MPNPPSSSGFSSNQHTPFITFIPAGVAPHPSTLLKVITTSLNAASIEDILKQAESDRETLDATYPAFQDAMSVRDVVFVREQGVPLENELDEDDWRSWHWVVYASVSSSYASRAGGGNIPGGSSGAERGDRSSTARIPVGTIRLIPPPHTPHRHHFVSPTPHHHADSPPPEGTGEKDGNYIKLGRLATLPAFRGLGIAKLLVETALSWACTHSEEIMSLVNTPLTSTTSLSKGSVSSAHKRNSSLLSSSGTSTASVVGASPLGPEAVRELMSSKKTWDGKVLVHAQKTVQKMWERFGFKLDGEMGEWDEEGIIHVGLWKKIEVKKPGKAGSGIGQMSSTIGIGTGGSTA